VGEEVRIGRAHARIDDPLPRIDEIRRRQLARPAAERRVVRKRMPLWMWIVHTRPSAEMSGMPVAMDGTKRYGRAT
jgi:hypothetical protein